MIRFGSTRRGEAALVAARQGFIEMEAPLDMALVSITLGRYLFQNHRNAELRSLASDTERRFGALCSDRRANRAVQLWKESLMARTASVEVFFEAWQDVQKSAMKLSVGSGILC